MIGKISDISHWNGRCYYPKAIENGLIATIIRYGSINNSTGVCYDDYIWRDNVADAEQYGVPYGAYFYLRPKFDGLLQGNFFVSLLKQSNPKLPAWIDVEEVGEYQNIVEALQCVKNAGYKTGIYTRQNIWDYNFSANPYWSTVNLWAARWASGLTSPWSDGRYRFRDWSNWKLWQHCVVVDSKILTSNLEWKFAGDLQCGEELIGFDENSTKRGIKLLRSLVMANKILSKPGIRLELSNGDVIKCSVEHPILSRYINKSGTIRTNIVWMRASEIKNKLDDGLRIVIPKYFNLWNEISTWESGYLAGALDGEGSLSLKYGSRYQAQFAQNENEMLDEFLRIANKFGYDFSNNFGNHGATHKIYLKGGKASLLKMLGELRPPRLMNKVLQCNDFGTLQSEFNPEVVDIRYIGNIEVAGLSTSTKTFFSDGYASHNSADGNNLATQYGFMGYPYGDSDLDLSYYNGTLEEFQSEYGIIAPNKTAYIVLQSGLRIRSAPNTSSTILGERTLGEVVVPIDYGGGDFWIKDIKGWSAVTNGGNTFMKKQAS